jgi:hypothetical protein
MEPGDVSRVDPTLRVWTPTEFASRWVQLRADEVGVFEGSSDRPGAVLQVHQESGTSRRFRMPDQMWAQLVREVVSQVESSKLQTAQSDPSAEIDR